jgi:hypothetical protein
VNKLANNKGKWIALVLIILVAVGGVSFMTYYLVGSKTQETIQDTQEKASTSDFTSNNPDIDLEWRVINKEAATATYLTSTIYVEELDAEGNTVSITEASGGGSSTRTDSTNVIKSGKPHRVYLKINQDGNVTALDKPIELTAEQTLEDPVRLDIKTSNFSLLRMRAYDLMDNNFMDTNETTDNTTTDWENMGAALMYESTTSDTAKTVGADEVINMRLEFKTQVADAEFGKNTLLCADIANDANSNDWNEPTVTKGTATLSDVKASLSSNDILALNSYEYCYDAGKIGESQVNIGYEQTTGAGVNPDYDYTIKAIAGADYEDDKNPGTLLVGKYFRTDSSRTEMATATPQLVKFDCS